MNKFIKSGSQMYGVAAQTCKGQQNWNSQAHILLGKCLLPKKGLVNYYVLANTFPKTMPKVYLQQALLERLEYSCHVFAKPAAGFLEHWGWQHPELFTFLWMTVDAISNFCI